MSLRLFRHPFRAMGSVCELHLYASAEAVSSQAASAARSVVARLETRYTRYREDSLTSRINASAGSGRWIDVDAETAGLLDYAAQAWQQSEGLFDMTSGVLRRAWDFRSGMLPEPSTIDALLPLVGWHHVEWERPRIRLPRVGMELDFGGFVKEYAADAAANACRAAGIAHGLVELGGDVSLIGPHPDGPAWRVGIQHPRQPECPIARVDLQQGAIASSGDYERFMEIDGRRYCHVLDPRSGWPVQGLAGVSVLAPQCLVAGTASTIALLQGRRGTTWLEELGLPFLAIDDEMKISGTLA